MTATTLQRLLKYPHAAVFEKDAGGELVLWINDDSPWSIAGDVMTAALGGVEFTYDLASLTVTGLIDALRADGFTVQHVSAAFDQFSAKVLVEGGSSEDGRIYAFTSLLWALFSGYSREVDAASYQLRQALLQMVLTTAEGEWLDLWGALFKVKRLAGELDGAYRVRIAKEAFRVRVNARAIELAIKDITGKDVQILEPWTTVFTLDQSTLSGGDLFQDADRVGPFWIQPQSFGSIDWSDVMPIIERNRAEGVMVLEPQVRMRGHVDATVGGEVRGIVRRVHAHRVTNEDLALLDYALIEDTSVLNLPSIHRQTRRHIGHASISTVTWPATTWQDAPWESITYIVQGKRTRSYRVYRGLVTYESQPWQDLPWSAVFTPSDTTLIRSKRTRSP